MFFIWGLITGIFVGIAFGLIISGLFSNDSRGSADPATLAEFNRLQERTRDYYNNPVVEYMKRSNYKP
jgi:hypothetical protein